MKTKLSCLLLVLVLVMSISSFPATASAATAYNSLTQSVTKYELTDTSLSVTVSITNSSSGRVYFNSYLAVYDSEGTQKDIAFVNNSNLRANRSTTITHKIDNYNYEQGDYAKCFVWDTKNNPIPLCDPVTFYPVYKFTVEGVVTGTNYSCNTPANEPMFAEILVTKTGDEDFCKLEEFYEFFAEDVEVRDLLGYRVTATVGMNENEELEVYSIAKSGTATTLTLDTDDIVYLDQNEIKYYTSDTQTTTAAIANSIGSAEYNNIIQNGLSENIYFDRYEITYMWEELDEITLLDNNNDGIIDFIFVTVFWDALEFVAEEIETEDDWYLIYGNDYGIELDYSDDSEFSYTIIRDGVEVGPEKLAVGDTITYVDERLHNVTIYASSKTVEGTITEYDDGIYIIDGTGYEISSAAYYWDEPDFYLGDKGVFYLNAFGKIAYADLETAFDTAQYVYMLEAGIGYGEFDDYYAILAVDATGETKAYTLQQKRMAVGSDGYLDEGYYAEEIFDEYLTNYQGLLKIALSTKGEITHIFFPDYHEFDVFEKYADDGYEELSAYNAAKRTYGTYDLSDVSAVFNVTYDEYGYEDVRISTVDKLFVGGSSYSFIGYGADNTIDILVTYDIEMPEEVVPEPEVGASQYVFLNDYASDESNPFEETYLLQVLTTDGKTQVYPLMAEGIDVYTEDGCEEDLYAEDVYHSWYLDDCYWSVIKIALTDDGEIAELYLPGCDEFTCDYTYENDEWEMTASYNKSKGAYGTVTLATSTPIFNIDPYNETVSVSKVSSLFTNGKSYSFVSYGVEGKTASALVTYIELEVTENDPVVKTTAYAYSLGTQVDTSDPFTDKVMLRVITATGEEKTYELADMIDVYFEDGYEENLYPYDIEYIMEDYVTPDWGVIKIGLTSDNKIAAIYLPGSEDLTFNDIYSEDYWVESASYNQSKNKYGDITVAKTTPVFTYTEYYDSWEYDYNISYSTVNNIFENNKSYSFIAFGASETKADVILMYSDGEEGGSSSLDVTSPVMVVTNTSQVLTSNGDITTKLTGIRGGKSISVLVDPDEYFDDVEDGNVIIYSENGDYVTDVNVLFASTLDDFYPDPWLLGGADGINNGYWEIGDDMYGEVGISAYYLTEDDSATPSYFTVEGESSWKLYYASGYKITVVDCTTRKPTVRTGTTADLKYSNNYDKMVFVKTIADSSTKVSDIVVFITPYEDEYVDDEAPPEYGY